MKEVRRTPEAGSGARPLDETDLAILRLLARDGRMSNSALAEEVGIAPSTCLNRIRHLREQGVIRGFRADIDPGAVGRPLQAVVFVRLHRSARSKIRTFANHLADLPGVLNVFVLAGANDFGVHVAVRDSNDLRDFVVGNLSERPEVAGTETNLIFQHIVPGRRHEA
ncbi:MAG: transcriptional regulator, AsnC family [Nocardioides sp.]|jgi:DNA-binding Lrp family transcriptional regulator|uniref:Lrp/AsnC family transcriptional regulator n=1 Tax=Nocardioides sp. TaxID=35761 RepID=UPI00262984D8|nr:Lrp/AsnC family transcriptional regulator [Nocardioides sp.]MCW2834966.1 transcriptional regulator, AsnC family [Nocardioides sp.]